MPRPTQETLMKSLAKDSQASAASPTASRGPQKVAPYSGYGLRESQRLGAYDLELLQSGPNTALGEYMRRYWQPVCLSQELTDVPKAIKILHEELVAFRD